MSRGHLIARQLSMLRAFYNKRFWPALLCTTLVLMLGCTTLLRPTATYAAATLWLPTPPGENWKVIQGYGCGTHTGGDLDALDLANTSGRTYGAPVRAAADGTVLIWVPGSGTLILNHGGGFYTQYTHMASAVATRQGTSFKRGDVIGTVGDRGTVGNPHLHFMAFTAQGAYASNRKTVPLAFAEGYDLSWKGGCNQHGGQVLTAGGQATSASENVPAGVAFQTTAEINHWYNSDISLEVIGTGAARGFATAWNAEPSAEAPQYQAMNIDAIHLSQAGEGLHTLHVRGWDADGKPTDATFGPIGYNSTAPEAPAPIQAVSIAAGETAGLHWEAAHDNASGLAGYKILRRY